MTKKTPEKTPNEQEVNDVNDEQDQTSVLPIDPGDYFDQNDNFDFDESIVIDSVAMMSLEINSANDGHTIGESGRYFVHEGSLCQIYRLDDPEKRYGGETGSVAMKVINDQFPDEKDISRLENEYNVLRYLANRDAAGGALNQTLRNGAAAIYLDWLDGNTLKEWIRSFHSVRASSWTMNSDNDGRKKILSVVKNTTWSLLDIHDAGVVHNNIRADHIIIKTDEKCSIKFISFGSASFLPRSDKNSNTDKRKDLISLGFIFYEIISGKSSLYTDHRQPLFLTSDYSSGSEEVSSVEEGQHDATQLYVSHIEVLSDLASRIPISFMKMIMALIESKMTARRYQSVNEVYQDLDHPNTFLNNSEIRPYIGKIKFPHDKLFGRNDHLSSIMNVCQRMNSARPSEMILVSGHSGTGKSTLVNHVGKILVKMGVNFTSGKFDQLQQAKPLSTIIDAFDGYFSEVMQSGQDVINKTKTSLLKALGSGVGVLTRIIPRLCAVMGISATDPVQIGFNDAQNRLKYLFESMISAIATPSQPLVLFLDDLQWADISSLQLIKSTLTKSENKCFLCIGSYRENEISNDHPFAEFLSDIITHKIPITKIELGNIDRTSVNALISDVICTPELETKPLTDIVYRKTGGNILFVIQFLQSLHSEGLLLFSLDSECWKWDSAEIETKTIPNDVIRLLVGKITTLPLHVQYILKLLSCIGSVCAESTLRLLINDIDHCTKESKTTSDKESDIFPSLKVAIDEGLVNKEGSSYHFTHDQVQSVAYSLIPRDERDLLHLQIGSIILKNMPNHERGNIFFVAMNQLNRGKLVMEDGMKEWVAELNLKAGREAISLSAFRNSASFFEAGISLLGSSCWDKNYKLSLQLHNFYAEVEFCNGHFDEVNRVTKIIIEQAKSFSDKTRAYLTFIKTLGAQRNLNNAAEVALAALGDLGEPIQHSDMGSLLRTVHVFAKMKDSQFLALKEMDDDMKRAAMKLLLVLAQFGFQIKSNHFPFALNRMLELTLIYGVCEESCAALAIISFVTCGIHGDWNGSSRTGEIALLLLERLQANEYACIVTSMVNLAKSWTEPLRLTMKQLFFSYEIGMQTGAIHDAMISACGYCYNSFFSGVDLLTLEKDIRRFRVQMSEYKQITSLHQLTPLAQTVLNLIGHSENPIELTGEFMTQSEFIEKSNQPFVVQTLIFCSWLAYLFGEYEIASSAISSRNEVEKNSIKKIEMHGMVPFIDCLVYLASSVKRKQNNSASELSEKLEEMKKLVSYSPRNNQHRMLLIEAEVAYLKNDFDVAMEKYDAAIIAAELIGYRHEQAVCNEKAGDFFMSQGNMIRATSHYSCAIDLYRQWGAQAKVDHLCKHVPL